MEIFVVTGYAAIAIAMFAVFRLPLNRWTVPAASLGGLFVVFTLIQVLNHYHPHSASSAQAPASGSGIGAESGAPQLVAWFRLNQQGRLQDGSTAEVTFDAIPGEVFSAEVRSVLASADLQQGLPGAPAETAPAALLPVLLAVTDERYALYHGSLAGNAAQAAVYGEDLPQLAVVRKTLLRMAAWMNYLSLPA